MRTAAIYCLRDTLIFLVLALLISCGRKDGKPTPIEEQRIAYDYLSQGCETSSEAERMEIFDKAVYHFANLVVRNDANDTLRANALYALRWIEAYQRHDYEAALQYLNQYFELVGNDHENYPAYLAYKADDLWHFGAQDSAKYYAYKALATPHEERHGVEYICHHVLWNIYEEREMSDSANLHRKLHLNTRRNRTFEPLTMDELKSQLTQHVITPEIEVRAFPPSSWTTIAILLCIAVTTVFLYHIRHRHTTKRKETVYTSSKEQSLESIDAQSSSDTLIHQLTDGRKAFEHTVAYTTLNALRIKEKELPEMTYALSKEIESTLFDSFKCACTTLLDNGNLNDQELITILSTYLGYSTNIIANLGHTTPNTIRKRKERLKKKLAPEFYKLLFGE